MHEEGPIRLTVDGPYITDEDRARAMLMAMATGRNVILTARPRRWWQFWKPKEKNNG